MSETFPACFSFSNNFILSESLSGSDDKNLGFETPEALTFIIGNLSNLKSVLSLLLL